MFAFVSANVVFAHRAGMLATQYARHCPRRKSGPYALWAARSRSSHLIDRDIDNNGARLHVRNYLSGNELRRGGTGDEHTANHEDVSERRILDRLCVRA